MSTTDQKVPARPEVDGLTEALASVLAEHRYRDVLGDYDIAPFYRHFGCSCGWEQNIAGMNGWRSWVAAHHQHVAEALNPVVAARVSEALAPAQTLADWYEAHPDVLIAAESCAIGLRAALSAVPAPTPADGGGRCSDCGHIHAASGCTGDPTPSDTWAGVTPAACDCPGVDR